jgi:hypothetical protein
MPDYPLCLKGDGIGIGACSDREQAEQKVFIPEAADHLPGYALQGIGVA